MTTSDPPADTPPAPVSPPDGRPVDAGWSDPVTVVVGDRLCTGCGFNLAGRPIAREPLYQLLVTRCPHCQRVAPMEEHPAQGPWLARWAMLGAALWMLVLIAMAAGSLGFTVGLTFAATIEATDGYERRVRSEFRDWRDQQGDSESRPKTLQTFWAARGPSLGFTIEEMEWDELMLLLIPSGGAAMAGVFWSLVLLQWRRRRVILGGVAVILGVLSLLALAWLIIASLPLVDSAHLVWTRLWMPLTMACGLVPATTFLVAIAVARPIARGLVRAFVPPPLRGALAFLWTVEGREPPPPQRRAAASSGATR